ncbi:hypothetical protein BDQ12DRAFT_726996 [Crucibulum laeve]|uniref:Uncharacterized protein n=1 Tax=Crucibulum laeve TaxID=68775 RepID=A0A5C3LME9_9AGAR|nr:hypothetical protein BDQ12DRAFT_726996 [Crucibulum laeve]
MISRASSIPKKRVASGGILNITKPLESPTPFTWGAPIPPPSINHTGFDLQRHSSISEEGSGSSDIRKTSPFSEFPSSPMSFSNFNLTFSASPPPSSRIRCSETLIYLTGWNQFCPNLREVQIIAGRSYRRRWQGNRWNEKIGMEIGT